MLPERDLKKKPEDRPLPNRPVDEFFVKMNRGVRRPKPSEQQVAQAIEAIQLLTQQAGLNESGPKGDPPRPNVCPNCRGMNVVRNRFCGYCGARMAADQPVVPPSAQPSDEQHVHHHHYHHYPQSAQIAPSEPSTPRTGDTETDGATFEPGAEQGIPKLVEDWSRFFNSQSLDQLVGLYSADAIVLRPQRAYAQGEAAIRQLFQVALDSGAGEFELECGDLGVAGEIACLAGRIRSLVPAGASGVRREETGKYLLVLRCEAGAWKIVADAWCMDEAQSANARPAESATILPMRFPVR